MIATFLVLFSNQISMIAITKLKCYLTWFDDYMQSEDGKEKVTPKLQRTSKSPSLQEKLVKPQRSVWVFLLCAGGFNVSGCKGCLIFYICFTVCNSDGKEYPNQRVCSDANDNLRHELHLSIVFGCQ